MKEANSEQKTHKLRRAVKILIFLALVAAGLYLARLVVGLGTAAMHYRSTPDFAEYLASHPVEPEAIADQLPTGDPIAVNAPWTTGSVDPLGLTPGEGEFVRAGQVLHLDVAHGDDSLLTLRQEYSLALRRDDWTHHGVHIGSASIETAPGLRAIVVTSISDPEKMVGEDSMGIGGAVVEVFLISGVGPSETRFHLYPGGNTWSGGPGIASTGEALPFWRKIIGITHNLQPLPEEGLIHYIRQRVSFDWKRYEEGHGGPSKGTLHHTVNTGEYSHGIKMKIEDSMEGANSGNLEMKKSLRRSWNGEIW